MAYCPACLVEYESWARECADCHVPLRPGMPPAEGTNESAAGEIDDLGLVTIQTFMGAAAAMNAQLARNILEAEGIQCVLIGENMARIIPLHQPILLQVEGQNAQRAEAILTEYFASAAEPDSESDLADE